MKKLSGTICILVLMGLILPVLTVPVGAMSTATWQAGHIMDEAIFFNKDALSESQIQDFLVAKLQNANTSTGKCDRYHATTNVSNQPPYTCLFEYQENTTTGENNIGKFNSSGQPYQVPGGKSAAQIIWEVGQTYNINPEVLLVLIQKEQGLVTDNWPWSLEYTHATGYACPDTAPCSSAYNGFYKQVDGAAWQFRQYVSNPSYYNIDIGTNNIQYNPDTTCGSSSLNVVNRVTAMLYNYTPYQPNTATLTASMGQTVNCGAYGTLNFWRYFNDWFGTTYSNSFSLVMSDDGSLTQYVVYGTLKQVIPTTDIKTAWGLQNVNLVKMPASYINGLTNGPNLDRLFTISGGSQVYFVDNGLKYRVASKQMLDAWNLSGRVISNVPQGLATIPFDGGSLGYAVKNAETPAAYMVDGADSNGNTILRQYNDPNVLQSWEGNSSVVTTLSDSFFGLMSQSVGTALSLTKVAYGGSEYQVIAQQRMPEAGATPPLYPGVAQNISAATYSRLTPTSPTTQFVRASDSPDVYMLDAGKRYKVNSPDILNAWTSLGSYVNTVNEGFINLIPVGGTLSTFNADTSGQLYVMNGTKKVVPSLLDSAYRSSGYYPASAALLSLYSSGSSVTGFLRSNGGQNIYMIDNSGHLHLIDSPQTAKLWGVSSNNITVAPAPMVNGYPQANSLSTFVSDGTTESVVIDGSLYTVNATTKTDWNLSNAQGFNDGTLNRFAAGGALVHMLQSSGKFYLVNSGIAFMTTDVNIADQWGTSGAPQLDDNIVTRSVPIQMMTRFARSNQTNDNRLFAVDHGSLYHLSLEQARNLGEQGSLSLMAVNPEAITKASITDWTAIVVQDSSGKAYIIDGGTKRSFPSATVQNFWTNNGSIPTLTESNGFLNLLPTNSIIERAIKGSAPNIYAAQGITKSWILSPATFSSTYAPYAAVSDALVNVLPAGPSIP